MLNMLKPVKLTPEATIISETVVVGTEQLFRSEQLSTALPVVAALPVDADDMDIVCVAATPALEVIQDGPRELWVKLSLTVCHEVSKHAYDNLHACV